MSVSLEFKHLLADRDDLREGETSWWLGNTAYRVILPRPRAIRRLWQRHLPNTDIRFLSSGPHYRMLALPIGTNKKKREAFLAELITKCKMGKQSWPLPEPETACGAA